jgi:hypothetical protein
MFGKSANLGQLILERTRERMHGAFVIWVYTTSIHQASLEKNSDMPSLGSGDRNCLVSGQCNLSLVHDGSMYAKSFFVVSGGQEDAALVTEHAASLLAFHSAACLLRTKVRHSVRGCATSAVSWFLVKSGLQSA